MAILVVIEMASVVDTRSMIIGSPSGNVNGGVN